MAEGTGKGGKIISLTKKRARRVQEKMMQRLGKSEHTTDEVYQEFVANFNKQQNTATRVQKEILRYMHSLRLMYQSCKSLKETMSEVYEPEWAGYDSYKDVMEQMILLWEDQLTTLHSKVVEPMSNYVAKFPDVKSRISKRDRKVVDYDMTKRELESQRQKVKVNDLKLQQAEETFATAKQLFDELTDDLYEELPTFYDSRIQFYASLFQSMFATESRFHEWIAKSDEQFSGLMDTLAAEAATGVHTTKKERSAVSTPKILSRPGEDSDEESEGDSHSQQDELPLSPSTPGASENNGSRPESSGTPSPTTPSRTPVRTDSTEKQKPTKPAPFSGSLKKTAPTKPARSVGSLEASDDAVVANGEITTSPTHEEAVVPDDEAVPEGAEEEPEPGAVETVKEETVETVEEVSSPAIKTPPPKPAPLVSMEGEAVPEEGGTRVEVTDSETPNVDKDTPADMEPADGEPAADEETRGSGEEQVQEPEEPPPTQTPSSDEPLPAVTVADPPNVLFKLVAAHPYVAEDEDELSFEKGDIILVIPYEDPEDEEEGWLMGVIEGTNKSGVFPKNFTKGFE